MFGATAVPVGIGITTIAIAVVLHLRRLREA
jgi:hypothetical protein